MTRGCCVAAFVNLCDHSHIPMVLSQDTTAWLNAKVNCIYQSFVSNIILIDYALIRYTHGTDGRRKYKNYHWVISREHVLIKVESEALVSTNDFRPVLTKSTISWERSIIILYLSRITWDARSLGCTKEELKLCEDCKTKENRSKVFKPIFSPRDINNSLNIIQNINMRKC